MATAIPTPTSVTGGNVKQVTVSTTPKTSSASPTSPSAGTTASGTTSVPGDPTSNLTGATRDAAKALIDLFNSYGLGTLAPKIVEMLIAGYSADTIAIELQNTSEYRTRFAANAARVKAGLPALTPAEYISTERAYRQLMSAAGLPVGFYDQHSDFQKFLESDVSPTELQGRIQSAQEAITRAPSETRDYFSQWYSSGDMIAYALDPSRAAPLIEQRIKAAEAAAIAQRQGFTLSQQTAESIGLTGTSFDNMQQGLGFIGVESQATSKLSQIYGGDNVTTEDLVAEVFQQDAKAAQKRAKLASQERAAFGGSSGTSTATFAKDAGSF